MMDASVSTSQGRLRPVPLDRRARDRAFQRLYDEHFRLVWAVVKSSGVPAAQCEDVAQEVWILVHRLVHRLREDASERAWLVSIAKKRVLQHHRTHARRQRREQRWGEGMADNADDDGARVEAKSVVDRMLDRMNEQQRLTYVLVHGYGLTGEEVAAAVGDSVNTVYSRLRLARRHVRRAADAAEVEERRIARSTWRPPSRAKRRMWGLLLVKLDLGRALGTTTAGGLSLKSLATTLGLAAAGLVALRVAIGPAEARMPPPSHTLQTTTTIATATGMASPSGDATDTTTPELVTDAPAPPVQTQRPELTPEHATRHHPRPTRSARRASTPQRSAEPSTLAEEAALLKDAKQALNGDRPGRALALLDDHARRFPDGELEDVRHGARIRALCALGRAPQARGEARRMADTHRGSIVARGIEDVCTTSSK